MMTQQNQKMNRAASLIVLVLTLSSALAASGSEVVDLDNGLTLTVYQADEIRNNPAVTAISLAAQNDQYVPFDRDDVVAALADMHGFEIDLNVNVYLLPTFPAQVASSYASTNNIYLAPGTGRIPAATQAYIATHEMGHVLTWAFMDNSPARWDAYLELRGLDRQTNGSSAAHADRAREIVAEDFRFLFGGALATSTGSIENHDLPLPSLVAGLRELMTSFLAEKALPVSPQVSAMAYPNPCNPRTTIEMALPAGVEANGPIRLDIFNLRGALVRTIDGGLASSGRVAIDWNGNDNQGSGVASGRYLYVLRAGQLQAQGSVTLVR